MRLWIQYKVHQLQREREARQRKMWERLQLCFWDNWISEVDNKLWKRMKGQILENFWFYTYGVQLLPPDLINNQKAHKDIPSFHWFAQGIKLQCKHSFQTEDRRRKRHVVHWTGTPLTETLAGTIWYECLNCHSIGSYSTWKAWGLGPPRGEQYLEGSCEFYLPHFLAGRGRE